MHARRLKFLYQARPIKNESGILNELSLSLVIPAKPRRGAGNGAVQQLKSGNWAGFGAELDALRPFLEELSQHSTGR
jgi:hypothetical protein